MEKGNRSAAKKVMLNKLVLSLVAQKIPLEALRSLCGTCTLWNHAFVPSVRDKQPELKLFCGPSPPAAAAGTSCEKKTLEEFIEFMKTSKGIPATKYLLYDVHEAVPEDLTHFFHSWGAGIKSLALENTMGRREEPPAVNTDLFRRIIFDLAPNVVDLRLCFDIRDKVTGPDSLLLAGSLPNLRRLHFCVLENGLSANHNHDWDQSHKTLLAALLRHASRLKSFSCVTPAFHQSVDNLEPLSVLRDHMPGPSLDNLTSLTIRMVGQPDLELLYELASSSRRRRDGHRLRLKELDASMNCADERYEQTLESFTRFLHSQAGSLTYLKLKVECRDVDEDDDDIEHPLVQFQLPVMPALRTFHLKRPSLVSARLVHPLEVSCPLLTRFVYVFDGTGERDGYLQDDMQGFGHPGVTDLKLDTNFVARSGQNTFLEAYRPLYQFQLITRLEIKVMMSQSEIFTEICGSMPALEEFTFKLNYSDDGEVYKQPAEDTSEGDHDLGEVDLDLDSLLAGVCKTNLGELHRILADMTQISVTSLQNILPKHKTQPSLPDLCALKKFVLDIRACGPLSCRLTDVGGYFGLALASPTLQRTTIEAEQRSLMFVRFGALVMQKCMEGMQQVLNPSADGTDREVTLLDGPIIEQLKKEAQGWAEQKGQTSTECGVLLSEKCQDLIRSVMSPPAALYVNLSRPPPKHFCPLCEEPFHSKAALDPHHRRAHF